MRLRLLAQAKNQDLDGASAPKGARGPGSRAVRRQLELILESADFDASRRSREFLRFIVEETLAGRSELLTQAAIATAVFGRRESFDPVVDPIVRIQAGRLRRSLERYYLLSGRRDVLRIELPRGSYVAGFRASVPVAEEDDAPVLLPPAGMGDGWPAVVLGEFEPAGDSPELLSIAAQMGDELALELGRYGAVRVLRNGGRNGLGPTAPPDHSRFGFAGRVHPAGEGLRVTAHLTDRMTGQEIWGDEYVITQPQSGRWSGSPYDVARVIAARIGAEEGIVVQHMASERRQRRAGERTPYDAFLLSYEAFFAHEPETFARALEAVRAVVTADPGCGWAWTRLARLSLANLTFEATAIPTSIEDAIAFAQQGVRADPSNRSARCVLASVLMVKGELTAALVEVEQALRTSPDSLVYLDIAGYLLTMLGEWDRGREILRSALERNPHCLPYVQFGLWANHLHRGELKQAHQAALEFRDPTFFMRAVMRASSLGLLGRTGEGRLEAAQLLSFKPDFAARGRALLGYYIKFPELMARIVEGLRQVGVKLA